MARLEKREEDGCTKRDHLEQLARKGDADAIAQLVLPECPEPMLYLVERAFDLHGSSGSGFGGVDRVTYSEIGAYMRAMDVQMEPFEITAIRTLDAALIETYSGTGKEAETKRADEPHRPDIPEWKKRPEGVEPQFTRPI